MRIAHFGTFDVDNYGDLLFPHIAEWRLPNLEWVHISPTGLNTLFKDSFHTITLDQALGMTFNAVIVGGGNIIHGKKTKLNFYQEIVSLAYPILWIGAAELAHKNRVPLIFNAPGIPRGRINIMEKKYLKMVFSNASYISIRDTTSSEIAMGLSLRTNPDVVPDTAFDISRMWPVNPISSSHQSNYVCVHLNQRYHLPVDYTAKYLDIISHKLSAQIRMITIGPCHGDIEFAMAVAKCMKNTPIIEPVTTLKEMAYSIAHSRFYLGSSMHGFITAMSYGVNALFVLKDQPMHKFPGLLKLYEMSQEVICYNWEQAATMVEKETLIKKHTKEIIFAKLDEHWDKVLKNIERGKVFSFRYYLRPWRMLLKYF